MKKFFTLVFISVLALISYGQNVIELTFDSFKEDPLYTPADTTISRRDNSVYITPENWLISLENESYRFYFNYYGATIAGTYSMTEEDFITDYTYGYNTDAKPYAKEISFQTCELTITATRPSATITRYVLEGNIVSTEDTTYLIHATHDILTATETVEAEILDATITPTEYGYVLTAKKADINLDLTLAIKWSFGIEGYFSSYHVDEEKTAITHNGTTFDPLELTMDVEYVAALSNDKPGYRIPNLQFMSPDVVAYNLNIEAPIVATDTIDVTCTNLVWDESNKSESSITFEASNGEYTVLGILSAESIKTGEYDSNNASVELTHTVSDTYIQPLQCTTTIAGNKLRGYTAEIEMLGNDHKMYLIHLDASNPTTDMENVKVTTGIKKVIVNNTLVIVKDGIKYNTMGQIIE